MKLNCLFFKYNIEFNRYICNFLLEFWGILFNRLIIFMCFGVWKERLIMLVIFLWKFNVINRIYVNFVILYNFIYFKWWVYIFMEIC